MKIDEEEINLNSEYEGFEDVNIICGVQRRPHELYLFLEPYLIITCFPHRNFIFQNCIYTFNFLFSY